MYESMWMYGWEMLLGVWGVVRVCFAGPVAWFGTLHLCGSLSSHLDSCSRRVTSWLTLTIRVV